jgi:hypothetical protein
MYVQRHNIPSPAASFTARYSYNVSEISVGFVMLSRSEASLVLEAEILRFACGLAQDDNLLRFSADVD